MSGQLDLGQLSRQIGRPGSPRDPGLRRRSSAQIATGRSVQNSRLPTTRELAAALGVNRGTVQTAYRRLAARRAGRGRVGSGTVVVGSSADRPEDPFRVDELVSRRAAAVPEETSDRGHSPARGGFFAAHSGREIFPAGGVHAHGLLRLEPAAGPLAVRSPARLVRSCAVEIARRLSESGLERSPEEILVVSGAQQGLDLLFRTFTDPGDSSRSSRRRIRERSRSLGWRGCRSLPLPMSPDGRGPAPAPRPARQARLPDARAAEPDRRHDVRTRRDRSCSMRPSRRRAHRRGRVRGAGVGNRDALGPTPRSRRLARDAFEGPRARDFASAGSPPSGHHRAAGPGQAHGRLPDAGARSRRPSPRFCARAPTARRARTRGGGRAAGVSAARALT